MNIYSDTKIFIVAPGNHHTGGVELLHQLCSEMISMGLDAYMVYYPTINFNKDNPVDDFYRKYHLPYAATIEDVPHNILIVNETATQYLYMTKNIRRVLWWLSVDNYFTSLSIQMNILSKSNLTTKKISKFFYFTDLDDDIEHWVQSEYARQFIDLNIGKEKSIKFVGDYLNQEFLGKHPKNSLIKKQDMIVYNPIKGFDFTKKLMAVSSDLKWTPIENMTPAEVKHCLSSAKVYIDFGNHPGKDRIPREAAMSGCVVITGRKGAAANNVDIKISNEFKFDEKTTPLTEIVAKIKSVMLDYENEYAKQEDYRNSIRQEREQFKHEVADALELPQPKEIVALIAEPEEYASMIDSLKNHRRTMKPCYIVNDKIAALTGTDNGKNIIQEHNVNHVILPNGNKLAAITTKDAAFLYREGRIRFFAFSISKKELVNAVRNSTNCHNTDCIVIGR